MLQGEEASTKKPVPNGVCPRLCPSPRLSKPEWCLLKHQCLLERNHRKRFLTSLHFGPWPPPPDIVRDPVKLSFKEVPTTLAVLQPANMRAHRHTHTSCSCIHTCTDAWVQSCSVGKNRQMGLAGIPPRQNGGDRFVLCIITCTNLSVCPWHEI